MGKYLNLLILILAALFVAWFGGLSRPYAAFGGEDVLALLIVTEAIRRYIEENKREKESARK